jgi:4-amino-4-deoxy-L-arabinose transferase-like glycosyltransferase
MPDLHRRAASPTGPGPAVLAQRDPLIALAILIACLALYLPTMSPSVVAADGGELQMLATVLGVSHPTGHPVLMLLGWLFVHLPLGGDPAFRVTLLGAIVLAAAAAILYLLIRELKIGRIPALAAALLAASASRLWMHAAAAEVYPLSSFFIVLGLWLLVRWAAGKTPLWAVTLALGFGLAHHISMRLLGPAVLVFILAVEPRLVLRPRRWLPALICLLLPLALYAYVPLRAAYFESLPELAGEILGVRKTIAAGFVSPHYYANGPLGLILALDYSQAFFGSRSFGLSTLGQYVEIVRGQFPLLVVPIALFGIGVLIRRQGKVSLLLLLTYFVVMAAALKYLADVGEDGDHFAPTYWLTAIWFAAGADAVRRRLSTTSGARLATAGRGRFWLDVALTAVIAGLPLVNIAAHYPQIVSLRQMNVDRDILSQPLPHAAALAGEWRLITPLRYWQRVEGVRPDLWIIHADPAGVSLLMQRALAAGTPFYAVRPTPAGARLLPLPMRDTSAISHPADLRLGPAVRWRGYDLLQADAARSATAAWQPGGVLLLTLYWQADAAVERDWTTFIHVLGEGDRKVAQVDRLPLAEYYRPSAWQPGLLLADQYEIVLPADLQPGRYRLIFGWYSAAERLRWADGRDAQPLTEIVVETAAAR